MSFVYAYYTIEPHLDEVGYGYRVRLYDGNEVEQTARVFHTRDDAEDYIQELRDCGELDVC